MHIRLEEANKEIARLNDELEELELADQFTR